MKLIVYSSRTRSFDGRIFVVRTVNNSAWVLELAALVEVHEAYRKVVAKAWPESKDAYIM
jgi:hypothetical protein